MKLTTKLTLALPLTLALLGIAYAQTTKQSPGAPQTSSATNGGRYQIVMSTLSGKNTFLLDTQTGRVWQFVTYPFLENDPNAWSILPRLDSEKEENQWQIQQPHKK